MSLGQEKGPCHWNDLVWKEPFATWAYRGRTEWVGGWLQDDSPSQGSDLSLFLSWFQPLAWVTFPTFWAWWGTGSGGMRSQVATALRCCWQLMTQWYASTARNMCRTTSSPSWILWVSLSPGTWGLGQGGVGTTSIGLNGRFLSGLVFSGGPGRLTAPQSSWTASSLVRQAWSGLTCTPSCGLISAVCVCAEVPTGHQCRPLSSWSLWIVSSGPSMTGDPACLWVEETSWRLIIWRKCPIPGWGDWPRNCQSDRGYSRATG